MAAQIVLVSDIPELWGYSSLKYKLKYKWSETESKLNACEISHWNLSGLILVTGVTEIQGEHQEKDFHPPPLNSTTTPWLLLPGGGVELRRHERQGCAICPTSLTW